MNIIDQIILLFSLLIINTNKLRPQYLDVT